MLDDEAVASASDAPLLITGATPRDVDDTALRIHLGSRRALGPLVRVQGGDLPIDPVLLADHCVRLREAAAAGSVLIVDVEAVHAAVEPLLLDLLQCGRDGRGSANGIRLIAGTTVALFDLVSAGQFSERLFYRLNVVHVISPATR